MPPSVIAPIKITAAINQYKYLKVFIFFFSLFVLLTIPEALGWNDASRFAQIQSLVEQGSLIIDHSVFADTGDKYFFANHFYSDKPPILALYAAPYYFILHKLGLSFEGNYRLACYLTTLLSIGMLSAVGLTVFRKILSEFLGTSNEWADIVTLIAGTGTLILPYSLVFNNHLVSGVLILIGFYYLLNIKQNGKFENGIYSGLFCSLAGSIDINFWLFTPFMLILFFRRSVRAGFAFAIAGIPIISLYLLLNFQTSGSLMPPAMNPTLWNYEGSAFSSASLSGLAQHQSIADTVVYGFHMLVGNRGMFLHTPVLFMALLGLVTAYRNRRQFQYRAEFSYILVAILMYIGLYIMRTVNYSGWAFGVRWFASLMLILSLPIAFVENEVKSSRSLRFLFILISGLSILFSLMGTYNPFTPAGTDLQEQLSPTNTVLASLRLLGNDFSLAISDSTKGKLFVQLKLLRLLVATGVVYAVFYRLARKITPLKLRS